jgi:formate transporter
MGFEHSIVNMFLFPSGLMLGGKFTLVDYFLWNEIPTVVGNLIGGPAFVGATLYATHHRTSPSRRASTVVRKGLDRGAHPLVGVAGGQVTNGKAE